MNADPTRIARTAARGLVLRPGAAVAISAPDAVLAAVSSLVESAGAQLAGDEEVAVPSGLTVVDELGTAPIGREARALIERVEPGGRVVVVVLGGTGGPSIEAFAESARPRLDMARAHGELVDGVAIVQGTRREPLPRAEIKRLRGLGHDISPTVLVGRSGLTSEVIDAAREAVERHGLIKVKLTPQATLDKQRAAEDVAWATGSQLVQRVGKTALLFRPDVKLDPPVSRSGRR